MTLRQAILPLMILMLLSVAYFKKENSGLTPLASGFNNDPLLVLVEQFPENFSQDDYWRFGSIPYIPLYQRFLKLIWSSPTADPGFRASIWLAALVFLTGVSLYAWFYFLSGMNLLSLSLAVAALVGYFENSWMFAIIGLRDINLSARQIYNVLIPAFLVMYLAWAFKPKKMLFFYFLLGLSVNIYPPIAVTAFLVFALSDLLSSRFSFSSIKTLAAGGLLFLVGASPFMVEYTHQRQEYFSALKANPAYQEMVQQIAASLTDAVREQYRGLFWSESSPGGDFSGLGRWFLLYPPLLLLAGLFLASTRLPGFCEKISPKRLQLLKNLFGLTIAFILLGWARQHFESNFGNWGRLLPRFQYLGNFLFFLLYGGVALYCGAVLRLDLTPNSRERTWMGRLLVGLAVLVAAQALLLAIKGQHNVFQALVIHNFLFWTLIVMFIGYAITGFGSPRAFSRYIAAMTILALGSGFSFHYGEYKLHYTYFPAGATYAVFVLLSGIALASTLVFILRKSTVRVSGLAIVMVLSFLSFSFQFIPRLYDNVALLWGKQDGAFRERFTKEPALRLAAAWARENTPAGARFLVSHAPDVRPFKVFALRSTPILRGSDYDIYQDLGLIYGAYNMDRLQQALRQGDVERLKQLGKELRTDYIFIYRDNNAFSSLKGIQPVYENHYYLIYHW